jgi:ABC-type bacteriocin/lantibiotic exporter with double-glycine peptidase domain
LNLSNINHFDSQGSTQKIPELKSLEPILEIKNLNLSIGKQEILKSIDLSVMPGEFVAIVGEVGAGKSQLLMSLMGETGAHFESFKLHGANAISMPGEQLRSFFCFVPQEGFIMSATLRENVAFDYDVLADHDPQILQCLRSAQFDLQQERISEGLDTEIGERGVNLSGGQKQRISLARVDFFSAPIVLIDDGLSAVDVETEDKLIDSILKGSWKNRTRILVTHRLTVLDEVDRIIFLESGRIQCEGTLSELLRTQPKFQKFAATIANSATAEEPKSMPLSSTVVLTDPILQSSAGEDQDG